MNKKSSARFTTVLIVLVVFIASGLVLSGPLYAQFSHFTSLETEKTPLEKTTPEASQSTEAREPSEGHSNLEDTEDNHIYTREEDSDEKTDDAEETKNIDEDKNEEDSPDNNSGGQEEETKTKESNSSSTGEESEDKSEETDTTDDASSGSSSLPETPSSSSSGQASTSSSADSSSSSSSSSSTSSEDSESEETDPPSPSYQWGNSREYSFRVTVQVVNQGETTSKNVQVQLPMLENNSPYQKTNLANTSHEKVDLSGRIGTFALGDLKAGESKDLVVDYSIRATPVSVNSTSETLEKAEAIFQRHAGSGNCHQLATAFVQDARSQGLKARVVTGFARPVRGHMTSGSLAGARHSWAEFYEESLGWVPVDLTFEYFAELPHASHLIETYSADDPIRLQGSGGSLTGSWQNEVR